MSKEQDIVTGNKLIAEFMGLPTVNGMKGYYRINNRAEQFASKPKYHSSWDWLMPVVEKIENCFEKSIMVTIKDVRCHIEMSTQYGVTKEGKDVDVPDCYSGYCKTKLEATFKSVIQFIQWYQQNQKPQ